MMPYVEQQRSRTCRLLSLCPYPHPESRVTAASLGHRWKRMADFSWENWAAREEKPRRRCIGGFSRRTKWSPSKSPARQPPSGRPSLAWYGELGFLSTPFQIKMGNQALSVVWRRPLTCIHERIGNCGGKCDGYQGAATTKSQGN